MTHEEKRKKRIERILELIRKVEGGKIEFDEVVSVVSYSEGCTQQKAAEYIKILVGQGFVKNFDGVLSAIKGKNEK